MASVSGGKQRNIWTLKDSDRRKARMPIVAIGLACALLLAGLVGIRFAFGGTVKFITWKDLLDDYTGNLTDGFLNGTLLSYEDVQQPGGLPGEVIVKDRIVSIKTSSWLRICTSPPPKPVNFCSGNRTIIVLESTQTGHGGASPAASKGTGPWFVDDPDHPLSGRFRAGQEIVMRLQVYEYFYDKFPDPYWNLETWPSESFVEYNPYMMTFAPSCLSKPELEVTYVHEPPAHPPGSASPIFVAPVLRLVAHDAMRSGQTYYWIDHFRNRAILDLGVVEPGAPAVFKAAFGAVNEENLTIEFYGGNVTGDGTAFFRLSLHNRTGENASADGGSEMWDPGPIPGVRAWPLSPGDGDPREAHGVATPINSITGGRWFPADDDAAGTDTVWFQVEIDLPLSSPAGRYTAMGNLFFRGQTDFLDTQFIKVALPIEFSVE